MNTTTAILLRAAVAAFISLWLVSCGKSGNVEAQAERRSPRNPLEIEAAASLMEQLKVGQLRTAQVSGSLRVAGRVQADETRMARVNAPVAGRIIALQALEGENVKRGQVLALIRSTELSAAQFSFLKAYSEETLAKAAAERAKLLLDAGVIGSAELQRREAVLIQASAELSSARDQLRVLGMTQDSIAKLESTRTVNSLTQIVSSIDGTVLERNVTIGQVVQPAETVFVVADLSHVWLVADVPEQTAGSLAVGKSVEAEIAALPNMAITGNLSFVSSIVNPETRTVMARMDLENPRRLFKPAMLATMLLKDSAEQHRMVPATAIIREENQDYVFVRTGPSKFVLRRVTLGPEFGQARVVTQGLTGDEEIVLNGAFHLNNERKRLALQGG